MKFYNSEDIASEFNVKNESEPIVKFIKKNFKYLQPIDDIEFYSNGFYNNVFKIKGKDLILKIGAPNTSKMVEYYKKIMDLQKQGKFNSFAKMHYFEYLKKSNLMLIIQDMYAPAKTIEQFNKVRIKYFIEDLYTRAERILAYNPTKEQFFSVIKTGTARNPMGEKYLDQYLNIIWDFYENGINSYDFHLGNIMLDKNNNLVAVDF